MKNREWMNKDFVCNMGAHEPQPSISKASRPHLDFTECRVERQKN